MLAQLPVRHTGARR